MKKHFKWLCILILMFALVAISPLVKSVAYADTQITESDITDTNLYSKLVKLGGGIIRSETFNKEKYATINLQGVTTVDKSSNIVDISSLTKFKFDYTTTLNISNNNITKITAEVLSAFPNLEELILSNNDLASIDLRGCYNLKKVIVDNNELSNINLSDLNPTDCEIDLSCNLLDSMSDIVFPAQIVGVNGVVNLYNNNITDFETAPEGYDINLGLQGLQSEEDFIERKQSIVYYKTGDSQNIKTVITSGETEVKTIIDSEITQPRTEISLPNGNYELSYYYINGETTEPVSIKNQINASVGKDYKKDYFRYYTYKSFNVQPSTPTYVYVIKGKEYQEGEFSQIKSEATIKVSADADTKIYYSIAGADWIEGSEVPIKKGGSYNVVIKAISLDGSYESEDVTIYINAASNLKFPDILIVLLIVIGAVLIFGVGMPLLRKYVF